MNNRDGERRDPNHPAAVNMAPAMVEDQRAEDRREPIPEKSWMKKCVEAYDRDTTINCPSCGHAFKDPWLARHKTQW